MYQNNLHLRELYLDFIQNFFLEEKPEPKTKQPIISEQISTQKDKINYPIWPNRDSLCWLNATMALLLHCNSLKKLFMADKLPDCQIRRLFQDYYSLLEKVNSPSAHIQDDEKIYYALAEMQEQAFTFLADKQGCKKGVNDSPIFAIPLLLKEKEEVLRIFEFHHKWSIQCEECQWQKTQQAAKVMLTFPKVSENFSFEQPVSLCSCLRCFATDQKRLLIYERLPQCIILHFEQGAGKTKLDEYDFTFENNGYYLSSIVLYTGVGQTSHFITWIRNIADETWLNCDDLLKNTRHFESAPNISGEEIHIMMLERSENKNGGEDYSPSESNSVDTIFSSSVSSQQTVITLDSDVSQDLTLVVDKDFEQPCIAHKKQLVADNYSKLKSDKIHQSGEPSSNCNCFPPVDSLVMKQQPHSLSNTTKVGFLDMFSHTDNLSSLAHTHSETATNALTFSNIPPLKSSTLCHTVPLLLPKENLNDIPECVSTDGKHKTSSETNSELPIKRLTFHDDTVMVSGKNLLVFQRPVRVRKRKILDDYYYPDDTKGLWNLLLKEVPLRRGNSQRTIKEVTVSKKRKQVQKCHDTVMQRILKAKDRSFESAEKICESPKKTSVSAKKNSVAAEKISELQLFRSCKTYSKKTPNTPQELQPPQEQTISVSSFSNKASGLGKHIQNNAKVSKKVRRGRTCSLVPATRRISKATNCSSESAENNSFLKLSKSLKTYAAEKTKLHISTINGRSISDNNRKLQPFLGINFLRNEMVKDSSGSVFIFKK